MSIREGGEGVGTYVGWRCRVGDGGGARRRWWCSTTVVAEQRGGVVVVVVVVGKEQPTMARLNHRSRFGQARAVLSDGHAPTLYCQIKRKVRAPL